MDRLTGNLQWLLTAIALVQVADIVIHVGSDMIEPIRLLSNVVIFLWLGIVASGRLNHTQERVAAGGFVGIYLLLNAIFLATEGITNPDNDDQFRTVLFVLVGLTAGLSVWLTSRSNSTTT